LVSYAIFLILIATTVAFAGPPPDPAPSKPEPLADSALPLLNPNADNRGDQDRAASSVKPNGIAVTANRDNQENHNAGSPSISSSTQNAVTSGNRANHARCGEVRLMGSEARASNDEDSEGEDNSRGLRLVECDRHDEKNTVASDATPANDDDEDDDDYDNDSYAKQVKDSGSKPAPGIESLFDYYRDTDGNFTLTAGWVATSLLRDALLQMSKDELVARDGVGTEPVGSRC
jgi:hypothetical protein